MTRAAIVAHVDRAAFAAGFIDRLRTAGLPVGHADAAVLCRALDVLGRAVLSDRRQLYWTMRITLVRRQSDLSTFDAVFAAVFDDAVFSLDPVAMRSRSTVRSGQQDRPVARDAAGRGGAGDTLPWTTLPRMSVVDESAAGDDDGSPVWVPRPSAIEAISGLPFDRLDTAQLRQVEAWLDGAIATWPRRRGRRERTRVDGRRIDLRATLARSRYTGWELADVVYRGAMWRDRRVVMICDVSASMQAYTSAYLHVMRVLTRYGRGETFAFGTTLTRMTPMLARSSVDDAIETASAQVTDRFGGTRIASSLQALVASRHGQTLRGAICVIASDGWDSDDPAQMTRAMARITRRTFAVVWLNPRAGADGYEPLVGGMAAALPYCDRVLPAATVADLADLVTAVTGLRRR
ncbi:VWA domain-containing protein [Gordonia sp. Z-3]|uniref:vWA domain-containing protein n=1 Tax=unclassified Gordonia (in: high G+C Gram-positive bacteria) TaxID=2657482 RepID=UPI00257BD2DB|nr:MULTISPECIES: VWA domain-containing protein [unclassified Gordonia (in: high G+C Gram-positive bacteria)]MED5799639.1 VWA domain-containing protein [Gordonia sp. Z-3]